MQMRTEDYREGDHRFISLLYGSYLDLCDEVLPAQ